MITREEIDTILNRLEDTIQEIQHGTVVMPVASSTVSTPASAIKEVTAIPESVATIATDSDSAVA